MTVQERLIEAMLWVAESMSRLTGESLEASLAAVREAYKDMGRV